MEGVFETPGRELDGFVRFSVEAADLAAVDPVIVVRVARGGRTGGRWTRWRRYCSSEQCNDVC